MKIRFSGIFMVGIMLITMLFSSVLYAQDEDLPSPGLTPDSPFYFFDKLGKNIGLFFAFGSEAKARKALQYAGERLAEARLMVAKNKLKEMEDATNDYDKYMTMVREKLTENSQQGWSANISERVAMVTNRHLDILENFKDKVPERTREALGRTREASINGQVNALRVLSVKKPQRALDICANVTEEQLEKIRVKVSANVTTASVTDVLDYAERIAALEEELTVKAAAIGANVTALQERLAHSTANRLEMLSAVYAKVPVQAQPAIASAIENSVEKYERTVAKLDGKNILSAASVNKTLEVIPIELRERIQVSTSNRIQVINAEPNNTAIPIKVTTQTQVQNRTRVENEDVPKPLIASVNQTIEKQKTENQEKNTLNTP